MKKTYTDFYSSPHDKNRLINEYQDTVQKIVFITKFPSHIFSFHFLYKSLNA